MVIRWGGGLVVGMLAVGALAVGAQRSAPSHAPAWAAKDLTGSAVLGGEVPLSLGNGSATLMRPHPANARLKVNFAFPLRDRAGLDALIASHRALPRAKLYDRFSPPRDQVAALAGWLKANGFTVTHAGADRMALTATATTAQVERTLHVQINDYLRRGYTWHGVKVKPYVFYANTGSPTVPARLGLQTISGLTSVSRFFTNAQLAAANGAPPIVVPPAKKNATAGADFRSGGYFPSDLRAMYDIAGHGFDGTGQTVGFTLWGAGERQNALSQYAQTTGDQPITVDPDCVAAGTTPTTPGSCESLQVAPDHLVTILENGNHANADGDYASNVETALDVEQAHGMATHVAMKYYDADCAPDPTPGSGNSDSDCNGSDVGLEDAVEDAASDPTLHSISNSWGYAGDPEFGANDPFKRTIENSFALAAAAGTTFYFSTGDFGTTMSGFPADSQYVVSVGGTSLYSTSDPSKRATATTWSAAGSWCSNIVARPSWQDVPQVDGAAPCAGRVIPDISAVADPQTGVKFISTRDNNGGVVNGQVGGTSLSAPLLNGMQAVTQSFLAAQSYPGAKPAIGFAAPVIYGLGTGGHADSYYRDVQCGNTAYRPAGPNGDAAGAGWDPATGWGEPDWFNFATGYAMALGATGLSVPASLATHYNWSCARTPTNASERAVSFGSSSVGYSAGSTESSPYYAQNPVTGILPAGAWGAVNTILKTTDGGRSWFPSNADMIGVACPSASACVEVGDGGRIRTTSDGGATWTDAASGFNKMLTQVQCPTAGVCYAAGDRGVVLRSADGGHTWANPSTGVSTNPSNPIYGLSCPSVNTCYGSDEYAHVFKTTDGGATWAQQRTPVTTPGIDVAGSGGPQPFAGLFGISCVSDTTCVAVGGFPPTGTDAPIVATDDGGQTWVRETSNSGAGNWLQSVSCVAGSTTCYAVGRNGTIVMTSDLASWTKLTSNATGMLNSISCTSTTACVATGQNGTVDVLAGTTWTATTGSAGGAYLAGVTCLNATTCTTVGRNGVTLATTDGTSWTQQAGGGTTQQINGMSCPSASACFAVGNGGTILSTTNAGQTWLAQTSGTTSTLSGVSCTSATACTAVGAGGVSVYTADGSTWSAGSGSGTSSLLGVSCAGGSCTAVGAGGTIVASADGGATWTAQTSGTTASLNAVSCRPGACYATGAVSNGSAVVLRGAGGSWTAQSSHAPLALNGIACLDALQCFAGGSTGTVVTTTDGGATWTQQDDPLSGATPALNAGGGATATNNVTVNAAACNAGRCVFGTGAGGDEMTSPLVVVTVKTTTPYGAQSFSLPAGSSALSVSPASEAADLQGTLTCTVDTSRFVPGTTQNPITGCNGLSDPGFSVVYDFADSTDQVVFPSGSTGVGGTVPATLSLALGAPASFGAFQPGVAHDYLAQTTATVTSTAGDATLSVSDPDTVAPGHLVNGAFVMPQLLQVGAARPGGILAYNPLAASPLALLTYNVPVSNDVLTIGFKQPVAANDALRTGSYSKTLTFTLSTTQP